MKLKRERPQFIAMYAKACRCMSLLIACLRWACVLSIQFTMWLGGYGPRGFHLQASDTWWSSNHTKTIILSVICSASALDLIEPFMLFHFDNKIKIYSILVFKELVESKNCILLVQVCKVLQSLLPEVETFMVLACLNHTNNTSLTLSRAGAHFNTTRDLIKWVGEHFSTISNGGIHQVARL